MISGSQSKSYGLNLVIPFFRAVRRTFKDRSFLSSQRDLKRLGFEPLGISLVIFKSVSREAVRAFLIQTSYFHCNSCFSIVLSKDVTRVVVLRMCGDCRRDWL